MSLFASHQARKAPPNASPAPMVSTTGILGTLAISVPPGMNARAGRGPSVTRMSARLSPSSVVAATSGGTPGHR